MASLNSYICLSPASVTLLIVTLQERRTYHNAQACMAFYNNETEAMVQHDAEAAKLDALIAAVQDQRT